MKTFDEFLMSGFPKPKKCWQRESSEVVKDNQPPSRGDTFSYSESQWLLSNNQASTNPIPSDSDNDESIPDSNSIDSEIDALSKS
jgi:hypothetical protein